MSWEVEQKFRLADTVAVRKRLAALGVEFDASIEQIDRYFNHPTRDFAQTDEAFRLRQVGRQNFVTHKGPKIDAASKTRRELELPLPDGAVIHEQFVELFESIGFKAVGTVRKQRECGRMVWEGQHVEVALDDVDGLGQFLELEITANDAGLAVAQSSLHSLAARLELESGERRSYLELLPNNST